MTRSMNKIEIIGLHEGICKKKQDMLLISSVVLFQELANNNGICVI